jgi:hypothetical protein
MYLYDTCITTSYAARVSVNHTTGYQQGCGAGTGTGQNRIHLGTSEPEPYSEYGSGSESKELKQTTQKK